MTTAERKYEIIRRITAVTDETILTKIEDWLGSNIPSSEANEIGLTEEGERELLRRLKKVRRKSAERQELEPCNGRGQSKVWPIE